MVRRRGPNRMARVFLSYAREDVEVARKLASVLADAGQTVWWDRHLHGGANFSNEIDRELKNAEASTRIAGASSSTDIAASATPTESPTPNCFTVGSPFRMKLPKVAIRVASCPPLSIQRSRRWDFGSCNASTWHLGIKMLEASRSRTCCLPSRKWQQTSP